MTVACELDRKITYKKKIKQLLLEAFYKDLVKNFCECRLSFIHRYRGWKQSSDTSELSKELLLMYFSKEFSNSYIERRLNWKSISLINFNNLSLNRHWTEDEQHTLKTQKKYFYNFYIRNFRIKLCFYKYFQWQKLFPPSTQILCVWLRFQNHLKHLRNSQSSLSSLILKI